MMSYFMEEVYRGSNPGYGSGDLIIATYGARGDRYAYGTYHEVMEDPENLPTGHREFKEEVMASMRAELESAEAYEPCGVDFLDSLFRESDRKRAEAMRKALEFMETR